MALRTHFNQPEIGCPGVAEFTVQRTEALFDHITGLRQISVAFGLHFRQRTVAVGFAHTRIAIGVFDYAEFFPDSKRAEETERSPTFREMAEAWLSTVNQLSHSTLSRYRGMLNSHVLPKIGDIPIDRIQYSTLAGLLATLDCSAKTRNNIATVIRQPFVLALRDGRIKDNPAQHLANAKVQKEPPDPFTLEEAEAILGYLKNEPVFHNYFELAFFSGMRTSELIALTWQDIDFQRQCVRVNKASVAGKLKSTKTHSYRDIELNSRALEALRRQ